MFQAEGRGRASQACSQLADASRIIVNRKENVAIRAASLVTCQSVIIVVATGTPAVLLGNDSVTPSLEVPIWLMEDDIASLEKKHGIELLPLDGGEPSAITGHMDFAQVRNNGTRRAMGFARMARVRENGAEEREGEENHRY